MNKRELIRALARKADVSQGEAADAVDELAHRILQMARRMRSAAEPIVPENLSPQPAAGIVLRRRKADADDHAG